MDDICVLSHGPLSVSRACANRILKPFGYLSRDAPPLPNTPETHITIWLFLRAPKHTCVVAQFATSLQPLSSLHVLPLDVDDDTEGKEEEDEQKGEQQDDRALAELYGFAIVLGRGPVVQDVMQLLVEEHRLGSSRI